MGGRVTAVKPVVELAVGEYLSGLAAATPVPGGGSAAALAGAMGSGLLCMVTRIAMRKAKDAPAQESLRWLEIEFERCLENLGVLSQEDIDAYDAVVLARKEAGKESRRFADCVAEATRVPLDTADAADAFDIDIVTVADDELLRCQRCKRVGAFGGFSGVGVRRHARLPSPACRRRNCDRGSDYCRRRLRARPA